MKETARNGVIWWNEDDLESQMKSPNILILS